MNFWTETNIML